MTRILIVSMPVGPLGSGFGGGAESAIRFVEKALIENNRQVEILCPAGSEWPNNNLKIIIVQQKSLKDIYSLRNVNTLSDSIKTMT